MASIATVPGDLGLLSGASNKVTSQIQPAASETPTNAGSAGFTPTVSNPSQAGNGGAAPGVTNTTPTPTSTDPNATPVGSDPTASMYDSSTLSAPMNSSSTMGAPSTVANVTPPTVAGGTAQTTANTATGTNWNVDGQQTVAGQLNGLLQSNSPYMQEAEAKARAAQVANGTLNSSMAIGAAQAANINAALPIAQADANTYAAAGKYAADTANTTSQFNAGQKNTVGVQNTAEQNTNLRADQSANMSAQQSNQAVSAQQALDTFDKAVAEQMQNTDSAGKLQLAQIDSNTKQAIENLDAQYKIQMQTSNSMAMTYQSMISSMTNIMSDPNLDGPSKQTAINNLTQMYSDSLKVQSQVSGLNLGSIIGPSSFGQVGANSPGAGTTSGGTPSDGNYPGGPNYNPHTYNPNTPEQAPGYQAGQGGGG